MCPTDNLPNHLATVLRQIARHDGDIAVIRKRVLSEITRHGTDPIHDIMLGDELPGDFNDRGQVEHHGSQLRVVLYGDD